MSEIASRDLRNDTAGVLRRVAGGEEVVITVRGRAVARVVPLEPVARRQPIATQALIARLRSRPHDPTWDDDLAWISAGTTDDLDPIR